MITFGAFGEHQLGRVGYISREGLHHDLRGGGACLGLGAGESERPLSMGFGLLPSLWPNSTRTKSPEVMEAVMVAK